jgi:hypothetical protein
MTGNPATGRPVAPGLWRRDAWVALLLTFAAVAAGCGSGSSPTGPSALPEHADLVATLTGDTDGPVAMLAAGGRTLAGVRGSSCWSGGAGSTACIDMTADVVVPKDYLVVKRGSVLEVAGDMQSVSGRLGTVGTRSGQPELSVVRELQFSFRTAALDVPSGDYTLELDGTWQWGDSPFYFGLRIR